MVTFQSRFATNLFTIMHEYAITGRVYCLPLISDMIRKDPNAFLNEKDNRGNTLFFHVLHLPQLAIPNMQLTIRCNFLQVLGNAGISPVSAAIQMNDPEILYIHIQQLLEAANCNALLPEKIIGYLLNTDMSKKTPAEIAIESRNPEILRLYLQVLQTVLTLGHILAFTKTCLRSGANLLEHIEFHADIDMLLTYVDFLDNAFGSEIAFAILFEQTIGRRQERALLDNLEKTGPHHFRWAMTLLQIIDHPEKRWGDLRIIRNAAHHLPHQGIDTQFNFRLFSPPLLPCDAGEAIESAAETEEKTEQHYWLPTGLLETMESEKAASSAPKLN
jgi:hypothetical protein